MSNGISFSSTKLPLTASPRMPGWQPRDVNDFLQARVCGSRALWQLDGQLIALNTGRVLSQVMGVQETLLETPLKKTFESPPKRLPLPDGRARESHAPLTHSAKIVVRDSIFYTDSKGTRMTQFRFRPTSVARRVSPVLGRAGRVTVARTADESMLLSRSRDETRLFTTITTPPHRVNGLLQTGWSYIGRRVKGLNGISNPGVVEQFGFVAGRQGGTWNWSGVGRCPSWYGRGQCIMHLSAKRIRPQDLDERLKTWMKEAGRSTLQIADADRAERDAKREREEEKKKQKRKVLGLF